MQQTTTRDRFNGNSITYYIDFLSQLNTSKLLIAYAKDNTPIAAWIFIFDQEVAIYYYGASTSEKEYRNLMAPYLLQWEAIKIAKKWWSLIYDFLWVATPWEKVWSLLGVTDFKLKLTPDIRKVSDSYIWINKSFIYNMMCLIRKCKQFIK
jgi:lipid II:glycine glycyltransferase (peptidoglycan interpeptide bridge formation enzyme)